MNIEFPHLDDTKFPGINNENTLSGVDVYKYQNDFDYYRWRGIVSVKLLNVLWNSNYADVPYFESDALRDEWFDNQEGIVKPLETYFNNTPETFVQLPVPYNDAFKYNYLVVNMPMQTSEEQPLDYEGVNTRVKRWYYFIEDIEQLSPNTTRFELTVDYWTTFIHSVNINYLMLERGHAPLALTDVDTYLNNPIENNEYLLADDFNYQRGDSVIQASNYTPIGNGKKYVVFAAPYAPSDFELFGGTDYSGNSTPPTYEDTSARWGYQLKVNGYQWKYGETNYNDAHLPIRGFTDQDAEIYNGTVCYAIEASLANEFFNRMAHTRVHFIHGIQAIFILAEDMFSRETGFQFEGVTIYRCHRQVNEMQYRLVKEAFNFDNNYKELAKLYTSPYSFLEITDDNGNSFNFNIENTGNIKMRSEVSLAFPWLRYNVFFTGINGDGTMQYTWKNLNDENVNKTMWESDFAKFMLNWDIPTYSIYISSENEYAANNAAGMNAKREGALKDYKNATRFANTNRENTADTMQTNTNNVAASGQTNTDNIAATGATNNTNVGVQNQANSTIVDESNDARSDIKGYQNVRDSTMFGYSNNKLRSDTNIDNGMIQTKVDLQNDTAAISAVSNGIASVATSAISGAVHAGPAGAALSGGTAAISAVATGVSTYVGITNNSAEAAAMIGANDLKASNAITYNLQMISETNDLRTDVTNRENLRDDNNTDTQNTASATKMNNTTTTNNANASRTQSTNNANASRTQTTETNNATYTRNANIEANKANLVQAQLEAEAQYKNARLQRPARQADYSGDAYPDIWMRRGYRFNIRTQSKAAIKQTGDAFLRFGYALHRVWNMANGFNYMKYFTFWKAEDIWVNDGTGVANIATNTIGDILLKGVTVWSDPTKIGMVSIYDNMKEGD